MTTDDRVIGVGFVLIGAFALPYFLSLIIEYSRITFVLSNVNSTVNFHGQFQFSYGDSSQLQQPNQNKYLPDPFSSIKKPYFA